MLKAELSEKLKDYAQFQKLLSPQESLAWLFNKFHEGHYRKNVLFGQYSNFHLISNTRNWAPYGRNFKANLTLDLQKCQAWDFQGLSCFRTPVHCCNLSEVFSFLHLSSISKPNAPGVVVSTPPRYILLIHDTRPYISYAIHSF